MTGLLHRLARIDDGTILRTAFYALLAGSLTMLALDYRELGAAAAQAGVRTGQPLLPAFGPDGPGTALPPGITADPDTLRQPLVVSLESGGVLTLTGTLDPGAADRFAAEIAARGEYVTTVSLNSPGGSVHDALAIGSLIREHGFATRVDDGALCASSCPLVLAGGTERRAGPAAAIGVHQIFATHPADALPAGPAAAATAMAEAQRTTALVSRHLAAMGIDPALWLHALETPPDRLYYLSPAERADYRLVTAPPA